MEFSKKYLIKPARGLFKKLSCGLNNGNDLTVKVEMESRICPPWSELMSDCLVNIFSRLSMEERWTGPMFVCKTWMKVCKDPSLNKVFDLETSFLYSPNPVNWWSPHFASRVDLILKSVVDCSQGGLTEIRVRHCTDISILYVAERCPNLEVLWVKYCPKVTCESMTKIAYNCNKLKELDISCSYEISPECLMILGTQCQNLQILKQNMLDPFEITRLRRMKFVPYNYLIEPWLFGNIEAGTIAKHMHQLKHLELQFSTMTDKGFIHLCKRSPTLEYLDLFGCNCVRT